MIENNLNSCNNLSSLVFDTQFGEISNNHINEYSHILGLSAYDDLMDHFTADKKAEIEAKMDALDNIDAKIDEVIKQRDSFTLNNPFYLSDDFDLYALYAVKKGAISSEDFCNLMIFKCTTREPKLSLEEITDYSLPTHSDRSSTAKYIKNALFWTFHGLVLTNEFTKVLIKMSEHSELSRHVLIYKIKNEDVEAEKKTITGRQAKIGFGFYNYFFMQLPDGTPQLAMLVVSLTLLRETIQEVFGPQAIGIHPVLCKSSLQKLHDEQLHENRRAIYIPTTLVECPKKADGLLATDIRFFKHDIYHWYIISTIPLHLRQLFLTMHSIFSEVAKAASDNSLLKCYSRHMCFRIIDLELNTFRRGVLSKLTEDEKLLYHVMVEADRAINNIVNEKYSPQDDPAETKTYLYACQIITNTFAKELSQVIKEFKPKVTFDEVSAKKVFDTFCKHSEAYFSDRKFGDFVSQQCSLSKHLHDNLVKVDESISPLYQAIHNNYLHSLEAIDRYGYINREWEYSYETITSINWHLDNRENLVFFGAMDALKKNIINYHEFCTIQMWRFLILEMKIYYGHSRIIRADSINHSDKTEFANDPILLSIFKGFLRAKDLEAIFNIMMKQPQKVKDCYHLIENPFAERNKKLSSFVNRLCNISNKGRKCFFIPSFSLINAIYIHKNRIEDIENQHIILNVPFNDSKLKKEFLKEQRKKFKGALPILGLQKESRTLFQKYSPLGYLYHHLEVLLKVKRRKKSSKSTANLQKRGSL